ncbi:hypothetical protein [Bradyrhizobium sp. UNPF46]|uniref:hypothetical protein n=1 Tax=Bradyrhizobium sp. UNPF46 TaxID=1141168 RepID=UPI00114DC88C|nr:hypothetical protein [Bradyrhizobium sp. UNPF46]
MTESDPTGDVPELPKGSKGGGAARFALNAVSGAIPLLGGLLSAGASAWSERDQARVNDFLHHMAEMLAAEMREKEKTILEITARIDMQDEKISERVKSSEYQGLLRKAFRDWAGTESEQKRIFIRNILSNAAGSTLASDDVVKLFLEWIKDYSELHFAVIGAIYNSAGITRGGIWRKLGRQAVREDSSDADLFKLIIRDLSTGGIARQHRETDYNGQFIPKRKTTPAPKGTVKPIKSAFDDEEEYELTALGDQFIHYAMTDLPLKLEYDPAAVNTPTS